MEAKSMIGGKNCEGCGQRDDCHEIYVKLGAAGGPSVTLRVLLAFLSPIVVFLAFLVGVERIAALYTNSAELRTVAGLLVALAGTFLWILAARVIAARLDHN